MYKVLFPALSSFAQILSFAHLFALLFVLADPSSAKLYKVHRELFYLSIVGVFALASLVACVSYWAYLFLGVF